MTARAARVRILLPASVALVAFLAGFAVARWWPSKAALSAVVEGAPPHLVAFDGALIRAAGESGVDADLLRGLVAAESGGDSRARSRAGAVGLAQLLPDTAAEEAKSLGIAGTPDLLDPATSLRLGARHLARLLEDFSGDPALALAAYNAGKASALRWRLRAPDTDGAGVVRREAYPETRHYVARVLKFREAYLAGAR